MRTSGSLEHGPASATLSLHDHVIWGGDGDVEFARLAARAFAGAGDDERLVLVGQLDRYSWDAGTHFADEIAAGRLLTFDVEETYAPVLAGGADYAARQQNAFEEVLDDALAAGYRSLRVVADNTAMLSLGAGPEQRWLAWEERTDRWQSAAPITGVCWFDRRQVSADSLHALAALHPLSYGVRAPGLRSYYATPPADPGPEVVLALDGAIEACDLAWVRGRLAAALAALPAGRTLVLDLSRVVYAHHTALLAVRAAEQGGRLRRRGEPPILLRLDGVLGQTD